MDKNNLKYDDGSVSAAMLQRLDKRDHDMQMAGFATGRLRLCFNSSCLALGQNLEEENEQQQTMRMIRQAFGISLEDRIEKLSHNLTIAETASYEALIEAQEVRDFAAQALKALQANAHVHPDGRRVYLSKDGSYAIDENLERLTDEQKTQVEWKPGAPTAEKYEDAFKNHDAAVKELKEIEQYRAKLDKIDERIENGNVTSDQELNELDIVMNDMPATIKTRMGQQSKGSSFAPATPSPNQLTVQPAVP